MTESPDNLRTIHVYVVEGDDVWITDSNDSLNIQWDPQSDVKAGETVSRLMSEVFNGKPFEFLNSAEKAYDPSTKAFYFLVMLRTIGGPTAAASNMKKVKSIWLTDEINKPDGESELIKDSFKHFKLLHKRV